MGWYSVNPMRSLIFNPKFILGCTDYHCSPWLAAESHRWSLLIYLVHQIPSNNGSNAISLVSKRWCTIEILLGLVEIPWFVIYCCGSIGSLIVFRWQLNLDVDIILFLCPDIWEITKRHGLTAGSFRHLLSWAMEPHTRHHLSMLLLCKAVSGLPINQSGNIISKILLHLAFEDF